MALPGSSNQAHQGPTVPETDARRRLESIRMKIEGDNATPEYLRGGLLADVEMLTRALVHDVRTADDGSDGGDQRLEQLLVRYRRDVAEVARGYPLAPPVTLQRLARRLIANGEAVLDLLDSAARHIS